MDVQELLIDTELRRRVDWVLRWGFRGWTQSMLGQRSAFNAEVVMLLLLAPLDFIEAYGGLPESDEHFQQVPGDAAAVAVAQIVASVRANPLGGPPAAQMVQWIQERRDKMPWLLPELEPAPPPDENLKDRQQQAVRMLAEGQFGPALLQVFGGNIEDAQAMMIEQLELEVLPNIIRKFPERARKWAAMLAEATA